MKKITLILSFLIVATSIFAQIGEDLTHDPKAKVILDELSANFKNYESVRMFFEYKLTSKQDTVTDSYNGYLFTKNNDKYKLIIPDIETFSNGEKVWQYNKKVAEINVTYADPESESMLTPYSLLSIYEEDFKYLLKAEVEFEVKRKKDGKIISQMQKMYMIDLYPENVSNSPYSIIRLWVNIEKTEIISVKYFGKDGGDYIIDIIKFSPNVIIDDKIFEYQKANYPKNVELIDLTE